MAEPESPTEALQAAAQAAERAHDKWEPPPKRKWDWTHEERRQLRHDHWVAVVAAAAPYLIAEGRRVAAAEIRAEAEREIEAQGSWFWFVHGEAGLKSGAEWAARIAEGGTP